MPQAIGERLRLQRVDVLNKRMTEMASLLGITPPHLTDIEKGRRTPSDALLVKISEHYRLPIAELRAGWSRPDEVVSEIASQDATTAAKVPEFLRTARNFTPEQWDQIIDQAGKIAEQKSPRRR